MKMQGRSVILISKKAVVAEDIIDKTKNVYAVSIYGDLLVCVVLYGSVARGTQTDESDIDIAIMLNKEETEDMRERMTDVVVDLELEYDKVLSVLRIDYRQFQLWENTMPFYKNMKRDGVILWQAA